MKIFGREPALVLGVFSAGLQLLVAFVLPWGEAEVAAVNAVATFVVGCLTAWATRAADGGSALQAAILGLAQSLLTLALVFGLSVSDEQSAAVMAFVAVVVSAFVRQNVAPKAVATP